MRHLFPAILHLVRKIEARPKDPVRAAHIGRRLHGMAPSFAPPTEHSHCPIADCPSCGSTDFRTAVSTQGVAFRCAGCGSLWRFELGHLSLVRNVA